jgi:hypothetical protein
MRLFAILAVVAGSLIGWSGAPAGAAPLCEKVWNTGTLVPPTSTSYCQPYTGATLCHFENAGADPQLHVYTEVCIPTVVAIP